MADSLSVNNDPQTGDANSPINKEPTKSPLEQSGPAGQVASGGPAGSSGAPPAAPESPAPAGSPFPPEAPSADFTPPTNNPAQPATPPVTPTEPAPAANPVPGEQGIPTPPNAAPPTSEADLGQSAPAPDTDEFLKSILQEQPQTTPAGQDANLTTQEAMPGEGNPTNPPLQEQVPVSNTNTPLQPPELNEKSIGQNTAPQPAPEPQPPEAMPEVNFNAGQKLTDNVSLDGVTNPAQPSVGAPTPPQANPPVSSNVFSGAEEPKPGSSRLKKVIIGVLVVLVLAGGYYVYTTMFSGTSSKKTTATKTATSSSSSTSSSTDDSQRKSDLIVLQQALINYYAASGSYPVSASFTFLNQSGNLLEKELVPMYLSKIPQDPSSSKAYAYKSDGKTFLLTAELDDANDAEAVIDSGKTLYKVDASTIATGEAGTTTGATSSGATSGQSSTTSTYPSSTSTGSAQAGSTAVSVPPVPSTP